jgi:hypothetical protein
MLPDHDDAYFSVWRLAWIAHQLTARPTALLDANIFYPTRQTLTLSDATLLEGLIGAPLIWLGLHPVLVYNLLLLVGGFAASAVATYYLGLRLTADWRAAWLAGFIFAFATYRVVHLPHLELQWTVWMPLALLGLDRLAETGRLRDGILAGAAAGLQALSSVYYGAFFGIAFAVFGLTLLAWTRGAKRWALARGLVAAAGVATIIALPYALAYSRTRSGPGAMRPDWEVKQYSAEWSDYAQVAPGSRLYRGTHRGTITDERTLYPGLVGPALALAALMPPIGPFTGAASITLATAFDASLGPNGHVFPVLRGLVPPMSGLRAAARFSVIVVLLLALLGAVGFARIGRKWPRVRTSLFAMGLVACAAEFYAGPVPVRPPIMKAPMLARFLKTQPPDTVVLHVPLPVSAGLLWREETRYQYLSIYHWRPLVNGYSGFAPPVYVKTLEALRKFPDAASFGRLRRLGVRYLFVHPNLLPPDEYARLTTILLTSPEVTPVDRFRDTVPVDVYALNTRK